MMYDFLFQLLLENSNLELHLKLKIDVSSNNLFWFLLKKEKIVTDIKGIILMVRV